MLVAFCDQPSGNSTSLCSNATLSPWPMCASRSSHSTVSNGCVPAVVNNRATASPLPVAVSVEIIGLRAGFIGLPLCCAGVADAHSKLQSGPSIIPPRADGKGPTTPTILVPEAQPVGEFGPRGGGAKAGLGDGVAHGEDRARFERAPARDRPCGARQDQQPGGGGDRD